MTPEEKAKVDFEMLDYAYKQGRRKRHSDFFNILMWVFVGFSIALLLFAAGVMKIGVKP